jgi:hypothetical protein
VQQAAGRRESARGVSRLTARRIDARKPAQHLNQISSVRS